MFLVVAVVSIVLLVWWYLRITETSHLSVHGKAILVTGCDSGIGFQMAVKMSKLGFHVFASCLIPDGEGAKALRKKERITVLEMDVTNDQSVQDAFLSVKNSLQNGKKLWAVVSNAGVCILGMMEWSTMNQSQQMVNVNVTGTIRVLKTFLPLIKEAQGRIVFVSSILVNVTIPGTLVYTCTKHALSSIADVLRLELSPYNVKTVCIEPGDHSKHTQLLGQKQNHSKDQWNEMDVDSREKVKELFNHFHKTLETWTKDTTIETGIKEEEEEPFHQILVSLKEALLNTNPKTNYLCAQLSEIFFVYFMKYLPVRLQVYLIKLSCRLVFGLKF